MSKRYEVAIKILDKEYIDQLIVALVRQGYSVYYNDESDSGKPVVCFTANDEEEITEIKETRY